jgi:hypothetical protein
MTANFYWSFFYRAVYLWSTCSGRPAVTAGAALLEDITGVRQSRGVSFDPALWTGVITEQYPPLESL